VGVNDAGFNVRIINQCLTLRHVTVKKEIVKYFCYKNKSYKKNCYAREVMKDTKLSPFTHKKRLTRSEDSLRGEISVVVVVAGEAKT
jgi:hypothetical protein